MTDAELAASYHRNLCRTLAGRWLPRLRDNQIQEIKILHQVRPPQVRMNTLQLCFKIYHSGMPSSVSLNFANVKHTQVMLIQV